MKTVVVSAAILIEQGRVLLTQRKSGTHLAGAWEFPGGKVEAGEDPREALQREMREEVGLAVQVGEIVDVTFHRYPDEAGAGGGKAVLLLFFDARRVAGSPGPRALDVAAVRWAGAGELDPREFPPADVAVLRKVVARLESGAAT